MTNQPISDDDAAMLLRGRTPEARPDLAPLAESIADLRAAAFESAPRPSAELSARLKLPKAAVVTAPEAVPAASNTGRVRQMIAWFTGLGVLAKILLASTVAAAAVVGTGAAGVLPGGAQQTFDDVIAVVSPATDDEPTATPTDEPTTEPTGEADEGEHPDNFGGDVSELAKDKPGSGMEFGKWVSETAKNKHSDGTDDSSDTEGDDPADSTDDGTDDSTGGTTHGNSGDHGGKPDDAGQSGSHGGGKN